MSTAERVASNTSASKPPVGRVTLLTAGLASLVVAPARLTLTMITLLTRVVLSLLAVILQLLLFPDGGGLYGAAFLLLLLAFVWTLSQLGVLLLVALLAYGDVLVQATTTSCLVAPTCGIAAAATAGSRTCEAMGPGAYQPPPPPLQQL